MTIDSLIMLMGAFVAMLPFLGFPIRIDNFLLMAAGIIMISLGIIVRRRGAAARARARAHQTYVESAPKAQVESHEAA